jgi:hypothetical protein
MFLETKRDGETAKPDIYALPTLIAWLEAKPAGEVYNYHNCHGACLLGQYLEANGIRWHGHASGNIHPYCELDRQTGWQKLAAARPWTFGAALARAKALLAERAGDS